MALPSKTREASKDSKNSIPRLDGFLRLPLPTVVAANAKENFSQNTIIRDTWEKRANEVECEVDDVGT